MERLTIKYENHYIPRKMCTVDRFDEVDDVDACNDICCDEPGACDGCPIQECFDRLAAYEDTDLTPEQIREIDKLYTEKCKELADRMKEPEQRMGRWIETSKWGQIQHVCSECQKGIVIRCMADNFKRNFCPNCGAEMEKE